MHRNTYFVVTLLAIFVALLIGVNIGHKLNGSSTKTEKTELPSPTPKVSTAINTKTYTNSVCGFSLQYPSTLTLLESASGSAMFINTANANQSVAVACQKDIPRPPIAASQTETGFITNSAATASVAATLYHDTSPKDGSSVDSLIFRIPGTTLDAYIAGFGDTYNQIIDTIRLTR